jgi:hypothetical protein
MARPRERVRLEDGLRINLNRLLRMGIAKIGPNPCSIYWEPGYSGETRTLGVVTWRLSGATHGSMRVLLRSLDQRIDLVAEPRHFGALQWYFVCPLTGRRASVLWMPPGASCFASRQAWGDKVAYCSQFQTPYYRALSRVHEIRYQLDGEDYRETPFIVPPLKPRYMHNKTYEAYLDRLEDVENKCDLLLTKLAERSNKAIKHCDRV